MSILNKGLNIFPTKKKVERMVELRAKERAARERVCLALDTSDAAAAVTLANELSAYVGFFKVGKELHTAAAQEGFRIVDKINDTTHDRKGNVFLDLKFHDTPPTVYGASIAAAVSGVRMFNIHIAGGKEMCMKALEGAYEGSERWVIKRPKVIGVTVLTSLDDADLAIQGLNVKYDDLVARRTELARQWNLAGVVCTANKAGELEKQFGSDFLYVTPGIKWAGKHGAGQKQLYTPDRAVRDCSNSILVIGSAITGAEDRKATAYAILQSMAQYL